MSRQQIQSLIRSTVHRFGSERLELEFRLGHSGPQGFRAGVPREHWERAKKALDASADFERSHAVTTESITGTGSKLVEPAADGGTRRWIHKRKLHHVDVPVDGTPWCARASLALEEPEPASGDTGGGDFRYRRRKERWSYRHRCWTLDLTRAVGNLPSQLDEDTESYEIELELTDVDELLVRPLDSLVAWALRITEDLCRIMSADAGSGAR